MHQNTQKQTPNTNSSQAEINKIYNNHLQKTIILEKDLTEYNNLVDELVKK